MTPLKAIRAKCLDCCCGQAYEVKLCPCSDCSLYPFRFGNNPNRTGIGNVKNLKKSLHSTNYSAHKHSNVDRCIPEDEGREREATQC